MRSLLVWCALALLVSASARAGELADFNAAVDAATDPQRAALFYLRTGNVLVAEIELEEGVARWQMVAERWGMAPPPAFADVADWPQRLAAVGEALAAARASAAEGDAEAAAAALVPLGSNLRALRAEAGVTVFADRVAEANHAMEALWVYRREAIDWANAEQLNDLRAKAAVTAYLYRRLQALAASDVAADPEFTRVVEGTLNGLDLMWGAIDRREETTVVNILREIRSFDDLLWLRFG